MHFIINTGDIGIGTVTAEPTLGGTISYWKKVDNAKGAHTLNVSQIRGIKTDSSMQR